VLRIAGVDPNDDETGVGLFSCGSDRGQVPGFSGGDWTTVLTPGPDLFGTGIAAVL
jgi:hypothetical protein